MSDGEEIPVAVIWKLRERIEVAVDGREWDACAELANEVCQQLRAAVGPATCRTGKPHLDAVYSVGTMRYQSAPRHAKRALDKMNRIIRTAKGTLG